MTQLAPPIYEPRGAAAKLWQTNAPEVLVEGPAGTGKTLAVCAKSFALAAHYPGIRVLWLRATRESMTETILAVFEEGLLKGTQAAVLFSGCSRRMRQSYDLPNGSNIVVAGLDTPDKIMSGEFDLVCIFEATEVSLTTYEHLLTRLRHGAFPSKRDQCICECNPGAPTHWLNQRANAGTMLRLLSRHRDNPKLWDEKAEAWTITGERYMARLNALTGTRRARLLEGRWVQAEGVVYEGWNPDIHLIDPFPIPREWRRIRSVDFGFTNPFVCGWWAIDPDGRMYRYREIYHTQRLCETHALDIRVAGGTEKYEATISDHDAEDRATLEKHGVSTMRANKEVTVGLQAVASRLALAHDGKPRLFVMKGCLIERDRSLAEAGKPCCLAEEFDSYVWPEGKDGKPMKEEPVKEFDHGMDEMRYAVVYVDDNPKAGNVRSTQLNETGEGQPERPRMTEGGPPPLRPNRVSYEGDEP